MKTRMRKLQQTEQHERGRIKKETTKTKSNYNNGLQNGFILNT